MRAQKTEVVVRLNTKKAHQSINKLARKMRALDSDFRVLCADMRRFVEAYDEANKKR